jgi:hypothetical protein
MSRAVNDRHARREQLEPLERVHVYLGTDDGDALGGVRVRQAQRAKARSGTTAAATSPAVIALDALGAPPASIQGRATGLSRR